MADSTGIDWLTGRLLSDWEHTRQSIEIILTTPFLTRVMRREFGGGLFDMVDRKMTQRQILAFYAAAAAALHRWEPRFRFTRAALNTDDGRMIKLGPTGVTSLRLQGLYYPRGHRGDYSVSEDATVRLIKPAA